MEAIPLPEHVRVREIASAEGSKLRLPKARSMGGDLGGLGDGPDKIAPEIKGNFEHLMLNGVHYGLLLISYF